ncbi:MAG: DUF1963 domain-containing protein [Verrucomicrobiae bacterium]|nr:DUF1963 domain-containing protein [Verrucomicrobiae bacterium]
MLLFYDYAIGPWCNGSTAARVIWDRTPVADLAARPLPNELVDLDAMDRAEHDQLVADPMVMIRNQPPEVIEVITSSLQPGETLEQFYRDIAGSMAFTSRYVFPAQPLTVAGGVAWPDTASVEASADPAIAAILAEDIGESYAELSRREGEWDGLRHVLDGIPIPDQDDPRYSTAILADPELTALSQRDWPAAFAIAQVRAGDWHLLLQLDLAGLTGAQLVEGIVCFLIHTDDLARGDFARVVSIYQQT